MKTNQEHDSFFAANLPGKQSLTAEPTRSVREPYVPPIIEVLSFKVEKGFAISSGPGVIPGRRW